MSKSRISASVNEELAEWVREHEEDVSALVEQGLNRIYNEHRYGKEQSLQRRKRELERKKQEHEAEMEQLNSEIEDVQEELDNIETVEEKEAEKIIQFAESLVSTRPEYRDNEGVGSLSAKDVREILTEVGIHYAEWQAGQRQMNNVPDELKEQDKSGFETGKYGQITDGEDFRTAYHQLTDEQVEEIRRLVEKRF